MITSDVDLSEIALQARLTQLKKEVPTRGIERYPLRLNDVSELPAELQSESVGSLVGGEAIQTIIAFPAQIQLGWKYVPKQALLFKTRSVIHVQASIWSDEEPQVEFIKGSDLLYMKVSLLLLYGHLEIVAKGPDSPAGIGVEFNTVSWELLSQPVQRLLLESRSVADRSADESEYSPAMQAVVEKLPVKFFSGVKIYGLLPGEVLQDLVFQPGTWKRWFVVFRRPATPNKLLLLTSNYVVVIEEDLRTKHGWIISYIPRNCIAGIEYRPGGLEPELTVELRRGDQSGVYTLSVKDETIEAWRRIWIAHGGRWQDHPGEVG